MEKDYSYFSVCSLHREDVYFIAEWGRGGGGGGGGAKYKLLSVFLATKKGDHDSSPSNEYISSEITFENL